MDFAPSLKVEIVPPVRAEFATGRRVAAGPEIDAMAEVWYALSVKQPWAALLAAGVKTVEVRTWPTNRRGRLLIHASKIPDLRPEGWNWISTPALITATERTGGIVGVGELVGCVRYTTGSAFEADRGRHLNAPAWFVDKGLYGLAFRDLRPVPFFPCPGNTFFFPVDGFIL